MNSFTVGKSLKLSDPRFLSCNLAIVITTTAGWLRGVRSGTQETLVPTASSQSNTGLSTMSKEALWLNSRELNAKIINKCSRYQILRYQENLLFLGKLSFKENLLLFFSLSIIFKLDGPGDYLHATKWIFHSKKKWKVEICSSLCWFEGFGGASVAVFGSVLATWHPYLFFPEGTDLTNHSSLNKYHGEQCCWEESCLKRLHIVNQLPEKLKLCCFTQLISPLASHFLKYKCKNSRESIPSYSSSFF